MSVEFIILTSLGLFAHIINPMIHLLVLELYLRRNSVLMTMARDLLIDLCSLDLTHDMVMLLL